MKKGIVFLILMLVTLPIVFSQQNVAPNINEIPQGEDAKLTLPIFSKTQIRVYEGSTLNFNIVDPNDERIVLIKNVMKIEEITTNHTLVSVSVNDGDFVERYMTPGKTFNISYDTKFLDHMEIRHLVTNTNEGKENVVLEFIVPFANTKAIVGSLPERTPMIDPTEVKSSRNTGNSNLTIYILIGVILVLLVIAGIVYFKKK